MCDISLTIPREGKAFKPTELGEVITQLMKERFPKIVNVKFTAQVENELDAVQRGDEDWVDTLQKFYDDFDKTVQKAKKEMDGVKIQLKEDETDVICEKCGRKMVVKFGRYGKFLACPADSMACIPLCSVERKASAYWCWNATLRPLAVPPTSTRRAYTRDTITPGPFPQP